MATSWFDQQRPNIPSTVRSGVAPIPGNFSLAQSVKGTMPTIPADGVDGGFNPVMTTGQGIDERAGAQTGPMIPPAAGSSTAPTGSLAGYTGAPININVPFNPQSFVGSDAYNFTKDEGLDALSRYHFANGTAGTGGFSRDVMKFASGNAANYWDKQLAHDTDIATGNANRTLTGLSSLSNTGLNAAGDQAGYGMEAGNAAAAGTVDQASALNTGVSGAAKSLAEYFARQKYERDARRAGAQGQANPANYPAPTNPYPANPGPLGGPAPGTPGGLFSGVDPNNPLIWHAR